MADQLRALEASLEAMELIKRVVPYVVAPNSLDILDAAIAQARTAIAAPAEPKAISQQVVLTALGSVDQLLAAAGYHPDSSARHQLSIALSALAAPVGAPPQELV